MRAGDALAALRAADDAHRDLIVDLLSMTGGGTPTVTTPTGLVAATSPPPY